MSQFSVGRPLQRSKIYGEVFLLRGGVPSGEVYCLRAVNGLRCTCREKLCGYCLPPAVVCDGSEIGTLAGDVRKHLGAMPKLGARAEDLRAASEGTPLHYANLYVAATPLIHNLLGGLVEVDSSGAGESRAVVIDHVEIRQSFYAEDGADGIKRPISGGAADSIRVAESRAGGVLAAVDEMVAL